MFNGFIRALTYISTFQLLFDGLQGASVISDSDLALLRSRTKEISFWRLNFAHGPAKERFLDMAGLVAKRIVRELAHSETSLSKEPSIENFRSAVVSLVDWWTSEITLSLGRGKTV